MEPAPESFEILGPKVEPRDDQSSTSCGTEESFEFLAYKSVSEEVPAQKEAVDVSIEFPSLKSASEEVPAHTEEESIEVLPYKSVSAGAPATIQAEEESIEVLPYQSVSVPARKETKEASIEVVPFKSLSDKVRFEEEVLAAKLESMSEEDRMKLDALETNRLLDEILQQTTIISTPVVEQVRVRLEELKLADNDGDLRRPEKRRSISPLVSDWLAALPIDHLSTLKTSIDDVDKKGTDSSAINASSECGSSSTTATTSIETSAPIIINDEFSFTSSNTSDDTVLINDLKADLSSSNTRSINNDSSYASSNESDDTVVLIDLSSATSVLTNDPKADLTSSTVILNNSPTKTTASKTDSSSSSNSESDNTVLLNNSRISGNESDSMVSLIKLHSEASALTNELKADSSDTSSNKCDEAVIVNNLLSEALTNELKADSSDTSSNKSDEAVIVNNLLSEALTNELKADSSDTSSNKSDEAVIVNNLLSEALTNELKADSSDTSSNKSDETVVVNNLLSETFVLNEPSNCSSNESDDKLIPNNSSESKADSSNNISNDTFVLNNSGSVTPALITEPKADSSNSICNDTIVLNNSGSVTPVLNTELTADSSNSISNDTVVLNNSGSVTPVLNTELTADSSNSISNDTIVLNNSGSVTPGLNTELTADSSNSISNDTIVLNNSGSVTPVLNTELTADSSNSISNDTIVLNNSGSVNTDPKADSNNSTNDNTVSVMLESEAAVGISDKIVPDILNVAINKICDQMVNPTNDNSQSDCNEQKQRRKSTGELVQIDVLNSKRLKDEKESFNTSSYSTDSDTCNTSVIFTPTAQNLDSNIKNVNYDFVRKLVADFIEKLPISDSNMIISSYEDEEMDNLLFFSSNTQGDCVNTLNTDNMSDSLVARQKKEAERQKKESLYYTRLLKLARELREEETTIAPENSATPWKWVPLVPTLTPYDISFVQDFGTLNLLDNSIYKLIKANFDSQHPVEISYFVKLLKVTNFYIKEKFKQNPQNEGLDHKTQELEASEYKDVLKKSHQVLFEELKKKSELRVRRLLASSPLTQELSSPNTKTNRSPLIKLENVDKKIAKKENIETGGKPEADVGKENVNTAGAGVQQYDLSVFSDSPAKGVCRRDTLFRLFDPLYEKVFVKDPTLPSPESLLKGSKTLKPILTPKGRKSGIIIPDDYEYQLNDVYNKVFSQIKDTLQDDRDLDLDLNELPSTIKLVRTRMDDAIEDKMKMEQELNQLKLDINQLQQERTSLELELHQKDEVILKTQGEAQKKNSQFKQEIKILQDKLSTLSEVESNDEVQGLNQQIETHKQTENNLNGKISELKEKIVAFENIMREYEDMIGKIVPESEKLKIEHDTAKRHLATLEIAFADVHTKYERCKEIIIGYKQNEETLTGTLEKSKLAAQKYEDRYETLKAHAKAQLEKANKELAAMKEKHQMELSKLTTIIRRLEIKNGSIQQALDQKTRECAELAQLCDEMAGPAP